MDRKKILIAEKEPNEAIELRKALIAAGYEVRIATNGADALVAVESFRPDLILSEMRLPVMDGPHLLQEIRNLSATQFLPFILVGSLKTLDERVSAMKLPVDDYLQKPLDAEETVARIESLIREVELLACSPQNNARGFSGSLSEMNLVDLLQTLEVGKKTAVLRLRQSGKEGNVFITEGQVIDACMADLEPRRGLLRMFTWSEGTFKVEMRIHDRPRMLTVSTRDLISEGMTRLYRWEQLTNQLPPLNSVVRLNGELSGTNFTEEENTLLQLTGSNGSKRIIDLIEESQFDDLRALTVFRNLYERHLLQALPLAEQNHNGDYLELLKKRQKNGRLATDPIRSIFKTALQKPEDSLPPQHDRRRTERRHQEDRRKHDRRRDSQQREKPRLFLNRSELIMIREKLAREDFEQN
jgi:DNA-binding response OmpR family regulator